MRRTILTALAVAGTLAISGCAARSAASETAAPAAMHQHAATAPSRAATAAAWRPSSPPAG